MKAIIIGNSDGIGLAVTRALLKRNWSLVGVSRSESALTDPSYAHVVADVRDRDYPARLKAIIEKEGPVDLCIYCAGIGELLDVHDMDGEVEVFDVNLMGMVKTVSCVIPMMVDAGKGHVIGISSLADGMLSPKGPSYHASKAGFSNYLEGLALALRPHGVHVSNVRFGFVATKMAKGDKKPFIMDKEKAARHVLACIEKKPVRHSAPWIMIPLVKLVAWKLKLSILFSKKIS